MTFKMIRTTVRPSSDIGFYRVTDKLLEFHLKRTGTPLETNQLEAAFLALGNRYLGTTIESNGNTQIITRSFVNEAAYDEANSVIELDVDIDEMRKDRETYNQANGITTEVTTLTV